MRFPSQSCIAAHFSHLLTADRTRCGSPAPTYSTCGSGCRPAHAHAPENRDSGEEVKRSLVLFLQEHVNPKQTRGGKKRRRSHRVCVCVRTPQSESRTVRHSRSSGLNCHAGWLADSDLPLTLGPDWLTHGSSSLASFMFLCTY